MNVLDLFSGIGGFSLGLERAGMRTIAFCERDEFCRAVLAKHWPSVPCFDDIHTVDSDRLAGLGPIDLISGGYPCQPFSQAGKRLGKADARHLWPQMRRVVAQVRPAWVIAENVAGHIALGLDEVLTDLEADGYAARALVIPAAAVDAWHIRARVWIVARNCNGQSESTSTVHEQVEGLCSDVTDPIGTELREQSGRRSGPNGADTAIPGNDGSSQSVADTTGSRRPDIEGGQTVGQVRGFASSSSSGGRGGGFMEWEPEPDVGRVAHGVPRRMDRLKSLGNSVVPRIPEIIGRAIMKVQHA